MIARCPGCDRPVGTFLRDGDELVCESCRDRHPRESDGRSCAAVPASSCRERTGASIAVLPGGTLESATSSSGASHGASSASGLPDESSLARRRSRKFLPGGRPARVSTPPLSDPAPPHLSIGDTDLPASRPRIFRRIP